MSVSRDDFVIAIRSAFLKKKTKQKFSLLSLILLSIIIIILSNYNVKVINYIKSGINEFIYRGSYVLSTPEKIFEKSNNSIKKHLKIYSSNIDNEIELNELRSRDLSLSILEFENQKLKEQLDDYLVSRELIFAKIIIDNNSPYLRSFIINKGSKNNIKKGMVVLDQNYLVGRVIEVNYATSRVLMLSDINSNIPITISPGNLQAIATGNGYDYANINYLKKSHFKKINKESIAYTSGTAGVLKSGIPVGKIVKLNNQDSEKIMLEFFSDFTQLQYVSVTSFINIDQQEIENKKKLTGEDSSSKKLSNDLTSIQPKEKISLLLKEKEINEEVRKKIERENNDLKDQISEIQKILFKNQKILKEQEKTIQSFEIDQEELKFLKLNLEFAEKCQKKRKLFSDKGFEVGTPEYKNCILNKGIILNE